MSTTPEALRLAAVLTRADAAATQLTNRQQAAAELRRLAAVEAERDRFSQESARHFIRAREWAERAGAMEAERDQARAEVEALRADAERYRWLRETHSFVGDGDGPNGFLGPMAQIGFTHTGVHGETWEGRADSEIIDRAIDAARKG